MDRSQIKQNTSENKSIVYAGFWIRILAAVIDGIILGIIGGVIQFTTVFSGLFGAGFLAKEPGEPSATAGTLIIGTIIVMILVIIAIQIAYFVGLTSAYGITIGKMVLGLKVVDTTGQKIGFGKAALREIVGKWISGLVFGLGYLWVAFDDKKQGWHDKIAGTVVVKTR